MAKVPIFAERQPGGMFSVQDMERHPNNVYFVGSAASKASDGEGFGQNPDAPFATLDYAISRTGVAAGDVFYLLPGHAETITSATGAVLDVAGVKIIGLGWGAKRPTFTLGAAAATISISAASVWLENVLIVNNFLNIVASITVAGTATDLTLKNIEIRDTSVVLGALIGLKVAADADRMTIDGMRIIAIALTAAATNGILFAGGCDGLVLRNSHFACGCTSGVVSASAAASINILVENVSLLNTDTTAGLGMAFHNSTTGYVNNVIGINLKNDVKAVTGTGLSYGPFCCYSNAAGAYAGLFDVAIDA